MPNELYHYGVKGMKWGVVKSVLQSKGTRNAVKRTGYKAAVRFTGQKIGQKMSRGDKGFDKDSRRNLRIDKKVSKRVKDLNSNYSKSQYRQDYQAFKTKGVKRINKRMNNGKTHNQAFAIEVGRRSAESILKKVGLRLVGAATVSYLATKGIQYANRNLPRLESQGIDFKNVIDLDPSMYKIIR